MNSAFAVEEQLYPHVTRFGSYVMDPREVVIIEGVYVVIAFSRLP